MPLFKCNICNCPSTVSFNLYTINSSVIRSETWGSFLSEEVSHPHDKNAAAELVCLICLSLIQAHSNNFLLKLSVLSAPLGLSLCDIFCSLQHPQICPAHLYTPYPYAAGPHSGDPFCKYLKITARHKSFNFLILFHSLWACLWNIKNVWKCFSCY